ncbi:YugN-like family protein [Gracilibacillus caseinilyticus]|uniref:YugN-like family protein n=1 Tax=Gracilibacillus caseinilyticus TaxID=2932256 RepID=A0ABY4EVV0_9BACI|nr:YugN family protein [Gracilibacillus caseinilyticus]UOQ47982.1 YugN-like family protein [Gracilibacillus caseinilyticus]
MKITDTGFEDVVVDLKPLDHVMENANFIRAGQWDYERVTYDYKIGSPETNITYYIRVQGYALEGDVDRGDAVIKLLTPLLGKHYYPTGIEYGEQENFPATTVERASKLLKNAKANLEPFIK